MHPVPATNPIYIREEEVKVTIREGDNSSDIYCTIMLGIMMDHPTDRILGETNSEVATEITIEE